MVIVSVKDGTHWALATSMVGSDIYVNDPLYLTRSYKLTEIVPNQSILYAVPNNWIRTVLS